jgi:RND family efflux transporter MFP subunit
MATALCPSCVELNDYAVGKLSDRESESVASHLDACPECQAALAGLQEAEDSLVAGLRGPFTADPFWEEPECGQAVARAQAAAGHDEVSLELPRRLGDYQMLMRLGSGGMGTVYKARQAGLDRVVALKILSRGRTEDPRAIARFEREMKAIGRLDHANIVRAYDAREIDGTAVLIMELVDGLDLAEIVQRLGPIALPDACELVRQTAMALECAHEHGLVHRDIKPSNVMLARSGEVKLLDLGLARFYAEGASPGDETTGTGQAMGTADYMAPEQASDSRGVDIRADLYSLGCTFYKLLTGRAPFSGPEYRTALDKMQAHVRHAPRPVRELVADVPEAVAAILDRMLSKEPVNRFATPAEVAEAVRPWCGGADLKALIARAVDTPRRPEEGRGGGKSPGKSDGEGDSGSSRPSGESARETKASPRPPLLLASWGWKWFAAQIILLLMAGGMGYFLGVIITIKKNGQTSQIEAPDGSRVVVDRSGNATIELPGKEDGGAPGGTETLTPIAPPPGDPRAKARPGTPDPFSDQVRRGVRWLGQNQFENAPSGQGQYSSQTSGTAGKPPEGMSLQGSLPATSSNRIGAAGPGTEARYPGASANYPPQTVPQPRKVPQLPVGVPPGPNPGSQSDRPGYPGSLPPGGRNAKLPAGMSNQPSYPGNPATVDSNKNSQASAPRRVVAVAHPQVAEIRDYEDYAGEVGDPIQESVKMPIDGHIEKKYIDFSDPKPMAVKQGDPLAEVISHEDAIKLIRLRQDASGAEAILKGFSNAPQPMPEKIRRQMAEAEQNAKAARHALEEAVKGVKRLTIVAPISGTANAQSEGGWGGASLDSDVELKAGRALTIISSPDSMNATFYVPERAVLAHRRLADRKPGWELSLPLEWGLEDVAGHPYQGKVVAVEDQIDPKTSAQTWHAMLPNKDGLLLKGMRVRIRLITGGLRKAVVIPEEAAIVFQKSGMRGTNVSVYVVDEENVLKRKQVRVQDSMNERRYVVIAGLKPDEWLVTSPRNQNLGTGMLVIPERAGAIDQPSPQPSLQPSSLPVQPPPAPGLPGGMTRGGKMPGGEAGLPVPGNPEPTREVSVTRPVAREVTDFEDFTGHIEAMQTAEIRARVTGNLVKIYVKPGDSVAKGQLLMEVDPRTYQAEVEKAASALKAAMVRRDARAEDVKRMETLARSSAISQADLAAAKDQLSEAEAALKAAEAVLKVAEIQLDFTRIVSPFAGKIGGPVLDVGNLATADKTVLASISSTDPVRVVFNVDERTTLAIQQKGGIGAGFLSVLCSVADDKGFAYRAKVDSIESRVDPTTGTVRFRAVLPNANGLLLPGLFVRDRLITSGPRTGLLVPERAIGSDQGQKFVYVVDGQNVVERRDVKCGQLCDRLREIREGLKADDRVMVAKPPEVGLGMKVQVKY